MLDISRDALPGEQERVSTLLSSIETGRLAVYGVLQGMGIGLDGLDPDEKFKFSKREEFLFSRWLVGKQLDGFKFRNIDQPITSLKLDNGTMSKIICGIEAEDRLSWDLRGIPAFLADSFCEVRKDILMDEERAKDFREALISAGTEALCIAIRNYDKDIGSLDAFVETCILRSFATVAKKENRLPLDLVDLSWLYWRTVHAFEQCHDGMTPNYGNLQHVIWMGRNLFPGNVPDDIHQLEDPALEAALHLLTDKLKTLEKRMFKEIGEPIRFDDPRVAALEEMYGEGGSMDFPWAYEGIPGTAGFDRELFMKKAGLNDREIKILTEHYNRSVLLDEDTRHKKARSAESKYDHKLQREIAKEVDLSNSRVQQIIKKAIGKLRKYAISNKYIRKDGLHYDLSGIDIDTHDSL